MAERSVILILEDDLETCEIIREVISRQPDAHGTEIVVFHDNKSAANFVSRHADQILGIIQDNNHPLMANGEMITRNAGLEFYRTIITQLAPLAKTVVFTGYPHWNSAREFLEDSRGRVRYVSKADRDSIEELAECINWILEGVSEEDIVNERTESEEFVGLIRVVSIPWEEICRRISSDDSLLHQMDPRRFEGLVAEIFRSKGWETELTAQTRDGGYDIIAVRRTDPVVQRVLIEAKRWRPERTVGVSVVRSLYGLRATESFSSLMLATSSYVSGDAKTAFQRQIPYELDFYERDKILDWCRAYGTVPVFGNLLDKRP